MLLKIMRGAKIAIGAALVFVGFLDLNAAAFGAQASGIILSAGGAGIVLLQGATMAIDYLDSQLQDPPAPPPGG